MEALEKLTAPIWPETALVQDDAVWTQLQWDVLFALMNAVIPAISGKASAADKQRTLLIPDEAYSAAERSVDRQLADPLSRGDFAQYMGEKATDQPRVKQSIVRVVQGLPIRGRTALGGVLKFMSTRVGAILLTGYCTPVQNQSAYALEQILHGWNNAHLRTFNNIGQSIITLATSCWLQSSPTFARFAGFPDVPINWKPAEGFQFKFLQFPPQPSDGSSHTTHKVVIETDVVIVGSGCGGAVCAKVLAEAGHKVIVVDKGYYFAPTQLPLPQDMAGQYLYEGGILKSVDGSTATLAGSTWGGGGTVNWGVSLKTPEYVRKEWAQQDGLEHFMTPEFEESLDRVCDFMGVDDQHVSQSHRGQLLLDGSRKLGWAAKPVPLNNGGKEHWCGHCTLGCFSNEKQGPSASWLPAAAEAGADFIEGFAVSRILFDESQVTTGVVGTWTSRDEKDGLSGPLESRTRVEVTIKAKKVIVSGGSLSSPRLLARSGVTNSHIGRNLHLHPCNSVGGFWKEETHPWDGGLITSYCTAFEDIDGTGHGVKLEPTSMIPYASLSVLPWRGGLDYKLAVARARNWNGYISLTRDRDTGRVSEEPLSGKIRIEYAPSAYDRAHMLEGVIALAKIIYVTGAEEIRAFLPGVEPFLCQTGTVDGDQDGGESIMTATSDDDTLKQKPLTSNERSIDDPKFAAWIASIRKAGNPIGKTIFQSAHQMGTCRMSTTPDKGVVDSRARVWGTKGLYVADASVFPSASGVNPMITTMGIADWIARGIVEDMRSV